MSFYSIDIEALAYPEAQEPQEAPARGILRPGQAIGPLRALCVLMVASFLFWLLLSMDIAYAQSVNIDLGEGGTLSARVIQLIILITVVSLAPSLLMMVTSFTRIVVVMSLLRTALGTQGAPPNNVLVSLALFMTLFIMQPVFEQIYRNAIQPLLAEQIDEQEAFAQAVTPVQTFMLKHVRPADLQLFLELGEFSELETPEQTPLRALIPAFMISELKRAFEIGFLLFVPFILIDMLIASILMSMGMMMLPPVIISLPFKLIFFVLVDGWSLVVGSLVRSFG